MFEQKFPKLVKISTLIHAGNEITKEDLNLLCHTLEDAILSLIESYSIDKSKQALTALERISAKCRE